MTTAPLRTLGRLLKELRGTTTQLSASRVLEISVQGVSRLENGIWVRISTPSLNALLDAYEVTEEQRKKVLNIWTQAREARSNGTAHGWWRAYADTYGAHLDHYLTLEEAADRLTIFHLTLLPGLLQTPAYRRAVVKAAYPQTSGVELERRIELITRRQERLQANSPAIQVDVLLAEAALRLLIGDQDVMADQMHALAKLDELPNVTIRVIPADVIGHPGLAIGNFTLCEFPPLPDLPTEPPMVYSESHEGALFLDAPDTVARYRSAVLEIQSVALSAQDSRQMILEIAENLR